MIGRWQSRARVRVHGTACATQTHTMRGRTCQLVCRNDGNHVPQRAGRIRRRTGGGFQTARDLVHDADAICRLRFHEIGQRAAHSKGWQRVDVRGRAFTGRQYWPLHSGDVWIRFARDPRSRDGSALIRNPAVTMSTPKWHMNTVEQRSSIVFTATVLPREQYAISGTTKRFATTGASGHWPRRNLVDEAGNLVARHPRARNR